MNDLDCLRVFLAFKFTRSHSLLLSLPPVVSVLVLVNSTHYRSLLFLLSVDVFRLPERGRQQDNGREKKPTDE